MVKEYLRYMDLFGTKCCFYSEQKLKLYTPLGGIISIISVTAAILIFIFISLSSFKRETPNIITSSIIDEEQKIKFNEEKIYIPWKIQNNKNNLNYSNILFPTIKYYSKDNKNDLLQTKILTYKFCNQTSMANIANEILIDSPLDQLYCIFQGIYIFSSLNLIFCSSSRIELVIEFGCSLLKLLKLISTKIIIIAHIEIKLIIPPKGVYNFNLWSE